MNGIVLLNKPAGITSFQALSVLKKKLATKKVGHTGTLDKFAEGLLIACTGKYTRISQYVTALPKEYVAWIVLGKTTTTLDPEGEVTDTGPVPSLSEIQRVIPGFIGSIQQRPPAYSAIHINGRRAWQRARNGEIVDPEPRRIIVENIVIQQYTPPRLCIRVNCHQGTYIRSLARDIALAAGTCAYVTRLQRTRVGSFSVSDAVSPEMFEPVVHVQKAGDFIAAFPGFIQMCADAALKEHLVYGKTLSPEMLPSDCGDGVIAFLDTSGELIAFVEKQGQRLQYTMVLAER
ncbi:MAG: tRNA pseudouridine(55) synthase TruB [Spirochaetales bacterium]|nr:tRNA pseudouridine(55) synthase TruB [Spirochaetales bacterium]